LRARRREQSYRDRSRDAYQSSRTNAFDLNDMDRYQPSHESPLS
jgi:hypothetical protein